ncbi:MAG TPA: methyl-accepting chemotaxis protein [Candidatus Binatia bacterium]|jgi:methyl-accepting chemotaxis protein
MKRFWPRAFFQKLMPATVRGKLTFWFLFLSLGPILAIGIIAYTSSRASLQGEIANKLDAVADNKAYILTAWFKAHLADAGSLSASQAVKDLVSPTFRVIYPNLAAKTDAERTQRVKDLIVARQETNPSYVDVLIVDSEGKVLVSSSRILPQEGKNLSELGLAKPIGNELAHVTPVFLSPIAQQHVMMVVSPVHDNNAKVVGRVILEVELRPIDRLIDERSGLGQTGEAVLIDRELRMLTQSRFSEPSTVLQTVPDSNPIRLGLQGNKGHEFFKDYRGVPAIASFRPLPEIGAVLIAKMDASEGLAPINKLGYVVASIIVLTFLVVGWASIVIARTISNPIREGVGFARQVAQGDLTVTLPAHDSSELGMLSLSLNQMAQDLSQIVIRITEMVQNTSSAASQISAAAEEQERTVASQAASINQVTTTIQELAQSSNQVGKTADEMSAQWREVSRLTEEGNRAVQKGIDEMNRLKVQSQGIAHSILNLSEQIQRISSIVLTVSSIAEQTNMLALNAAIEAARAGEHGKGFAVVATEVRKLADQSQKAAAQIGAIIQEIQAATQNTILAVEEGNKGVEEGVRQIFQAGETLQGVTATIKQTMGSVQEITLATRQQAIGADQVSDAMRAIDQGMRETVIGTKETNLAASQLMTLGQSLDQLVKRFRTAEGDHFEIFETTKN